MARLFLSPPETGPEERRLLLDALDSNWVAPLGPHVDAFEREMAAVAGVSHGAALSSGTAALHLALRLLGVGPGDEVLVPSLTFIASAAAVTYQGARPVFVDCDPATWAVDPGLVDEALTAGARKGHRPVAVMSVDLYGQCADYDALEKVCAHHGVPLIEDAAEALGSSYRGRPAGSFGAMAAFSFNGNKIITSSGGGMLVSDYGAQISRARWLASQARDAAPHYQHTEVGYNYRMSNLLAALGRAQLADLPRRVSRRRAINARYRALLADTPGVSFLTEAPDVVSNWWLTVIAVDPVVAGASATDIREALEALNIESRPVWKPLHLQPAFAPAALAGPGHCERLFATGLCLPSGSSLADDDVDRVAEVVDAVVRRQAPAPTESLGASR